MALRSQGGIDTTGRIELRPDTTTTVHQHYGISASAVVLTVPENQAAIDEINDFGAIAIQPGVPDKGYMTITHSNSTEQRVFGYWWINGQGSLPPAGSPPPPPPPPPGGGPSIDDITFALTADKTQMTENADTVTFTITNAAYTLTGSDSITLNLATSGSIVSADFASAFNTVVQAAADAAAGVAYNGTGILTFTAGAATTFVWTMTSVADNVTEGSETLGVGINSVSRGTIVSGSANVSVIILDTSQDPPVPPTGSAFDPDVTEPMPVYDFAVGSRTTPTKRPGVTALPAGASYQGGNVILVTGNDVTIEGWNFTGTGFGLIEVEGNRCIVQDNVFDYNGQVKMFSTSSGNVVRYNTMDWNEYQGSGALTCAIWHHPNRGSGDYNTCRGSHLSEFNYIDGWADNGISYAGGTIRKNWIYNGGWVVGRHADAVEFIHTTVPSVIEGNFLSGKSNGPGLLVQYSNAAIKGWDNAAQNSYINHTIDIRRNVLQHGSNTIMSYGPFRGTGKLSIYENWFGNNVIWGDGTDPNPPTSMYSLSTPVHADAEFFNNHYLTGVSIGNVNAPAAIAPSFVTPPTISGTAEVAEILTATSGSINGAPGPTSTWQWFNNGTTLGSANGAQTTTYTLQAGDETDLITVRQTITNASGTASQFSASVGPIQPAGAPAANPTIRVKGSVSSAMGVGNVAGTVGISPTVSSYSVGDRLILFVRSLIGITTPSGWTKIGTTSAATPYGAMECFYKVAASTSETMPSITMQDSRYGSWLMGVIYAVQDSTGGVEAPDTVEDFNDADTTIEGVEVITTGTGRLVFNAFGWSDNYPDLALGAHPGAPESGWTEQSEFTNTAGYCDSMAIDTIVQATAATVTAPIRDVTRAVTGDHTCVGFAVY